ncbi:hypothetical protein [Halobacillus amylolyticus]|uniref:Uncharacterized protein n=1 Tax=Halobacillus amylolyticus TaxID=2932259 RepID=A0ABY4HH82_9BACI|nr:hypothetical protein [Halobacillus amylolyticus]UOR13653.1 hypothetical protein MUO15_09520 [Halobacillus amylolyticus]
MVLVTIMILVKRKMIVMILVTIMILVKRKIRRNIVAVAAGIIKESFYNLKGV